MERERIPMQRIPGISLYHQIKEDLRSRTESLPAGTKIETEQELSAFYGVSRGTVRQAVSDLVSEGHLVKIQGSGTFRAQSSGLHQAYFVTRSFTQQILDAGQTPGIRNIALSEEPASDRIAQYLGLAKGTPTFKLSRLRTANSEVYGLGVCHIRKEFVPSLRAEDLEMSLIEMFESRFGIPLCNRRSYCTASSASTELAGALSIPVNTPILQIEHVASASDGKPVFVDTFYLRNTFTLILEPMHHP